jgi:DNA-binding MarR family transcriptional regulator
MPSRALEQQVVLSLRRITRATELHSRDLLQQVGLTSPQLATLQSISRLQPVAAGSLARSIHLSQATITGILTRLETRDLISRRRCGVDRRTVYIELTEQGVRTLEQAPSLLHAQFRNELRRLNEWEQTQMLATLQRIAEMMDVEQSRGALPDVGPEPISGHASTGRDARPPNKSLEATD